MCNRETGESIDVCNIVQFKAWKGDLGCDVSSSDARKMRTLSLSDADRAWLRAATMHETLHACARGEPSAGVRVGS